MSSIVFKLCFGNEIRRTRLETTALSISTLVKVSRELFPQVGQKTLAFSYLDEDNDAITVVTDEDLAEAFMFAAETPSSLLKLTIIPKTGCKKPHYGVICDGCNKEIGTGLRFKCLNCEDFDFCQDCESRKNQANGPKHHEGHMFLRLETPIGLPHRARLLNSNGRPCGTRGTAHTYVTCDSCDKGIVGNRYKCAVCCDYDLCETCLPTCSFIHPEQHPFLKIEVPTLLGWNYSSLLYEAKKGILLPSPRISASTRRAGCPARRGGCHRQRCHQPHQHHHHHAQPQPTPEPTAEQQVDSQQSQQEQEPFTPTLPPYEPSVPQPQESPAYERPKTPEIVSEVVIERVPEVLEPKTEERVERKVQEKQEEERKQESEEETRFAEPLRVLEEMGFSQRHHNLSLLRKYSGNADRVIETLLS